MADKIINTETDEAIEEIESKQDINNLGVIRKYLKERKDFIAVINDKEVIFNLPLPPAEVIVELNYYLDNDPKMTDEEDIVKYINKHFKGNDLKTLIYHWDKYIIEWKKATASTPNTLSPRSAKTSIENIPELGFGKDHSYEEYIKEENTEDRE